MHYNLDLKKTIIKISMGPIMRILHLHASPQHKLMVISVVHIFFFQYKTKILDIINKIEPNLPTQITKCYTENFVINSFIYIFCIYYKLNKNYISIKNLYLNSVGYPDPG